MKTIVLIVSSVFIRAAVILLVVGIGLVAIGSALASWPFMAKSPNMRKAMVTGEAISAVLTAAMVFFKTPSD